MKVIDKLIISSPYEKPSKYWNYDTLSKEFNLKGGRRLAGYTAANPNHQGVEDQGVFRPMEMVNKIRPLVDKWRGDGWVGATGTSKKLLRYWHERDGEDDKRFFFCQLEAIETLIWLCEVANPEARDILDKIEGDGGDFIRLCCKMATGSGKTIVMGMIISWQILNKVTSPEDTRFSKNILMIAPGLTVKDRLQVLDPNNENNYYGEFDLIPIGMKEMFNQGNVVIHNWHTLAWETAEKIQKRKSVDKRGTKSDTAYVKDILGNAFNENDWIVINDEAHHAWRSNPADPHKGKGDKLDSKDDVNYYKDDKKSATIWIQGLDRVHKDNNIKYCFDMSATPIAPTGGKSDETILYNWIISDFGLNDAIESGLVKTPRVPTRDSSKKSDEQRRSYLFHIYRAPGVSEDLIRNGESFENEPLPEIVMEAYNLMASKWKENYNEWKKQESKVPPVMITVANNVTTSARIKNAFTERRVLENELCKKERILQIDSKVLKEAEKVEEKYDLAESDSSEETGTRKEIEAKLRERVRTVGVEDAPGAQFCNIISVYMLSEGWDAKTVTNIIGLRAFSSQLLCEQVIGRGLRRASYDIGDDGLFRPEHVDIYGVPFTFLPHEGSATFPPITPKKLIKTDPSKIAHKICWPNILSINYKYHNKIKIDLDKIKPLEFDPEKHMTSSINFPTIEGKVMDRQVKEDVHNLDNVLEGKRFSSYVFHTAREVYKEYLKVIKKSAYDNNGDEIDATHDIEAMRQIIKIVQDFIAAGKIKIMHRIPDNEWLECKNFNHQEDKEILLTDFSSSRKVISRIAKGLTQSGIEKINIIYDPFSKVRCSSDMPQWHTGKPCNDGKKSHINLTVYDSRWEDSYAYMFDRDDKVKSYIKNDKHVDFKIFYIYKGALKRYYPDYIVEIENKKGGIEKLIVEVKGQEREGEPEKETAVQEWVKAVNQSEEWGTWRYEKYGDTAKS